MCDLCSSKKLISFIWFFSCVNYIFFKPSEASSCVRHVSGMYCIFFFMNKLLFRLKGRILERLALLMYPASENTLSDGTEVAGVHSKAFTALRGHGSFRRSKFGFLDYSIFSLYIPSS